MYSTIEKLHLRVDQIRDLTPHIRTYRLCNSNGKELPLVTAGAHVMLPLTLAKGVRDIRRFFLCSNPAQRNFYEVAMQRNSSDEYLREMDSIVVGSEIECDLPDNNFQLHADASPAILMATDIGIAPILTIAYTLAARGRRFSVHYEGRNKSEMAFVDELQREFPRQCHFYYADETRQIDITQLLSDSPGNSLFYVCGDQKFLNSVDTQARALGIARDRIQQELSSPEILQKDAAIVVELAYSNKLIHVKPDQPMLSALRDAGVPVKFDCCVGDCGTCALKIIEGEAEHRDHVLTDAQKEAGFVCVCVSRSKSEKLVLAL